MKFIPVWAADGQRRGENRAYSEYTEKMLKASEIYIYISYMIVIQSALIKRKKMKIEKVG